MTPPKNVPALVPCSFERHAPAILEILNDAILTSTALYDYQARTMDHMIAWFDVKARGGFPVLGIEDPDGPAGALLAFGSFGAFRPFPANKYTVEHSVYVRKDQRGRGLGRVVLEALIAAATERQLHCMIGGIDATNAGSIALHERLGFTHAGTLPQVGFKFSKWLDLAFYQLILPTPHQPVDG